MKRLFIAAAAAIVLAGCSQNQLENTSVGQKRIEFRNLNDKVNSRAANDNGSDYQVYAAWTGGTNWFIDDAVTPGTPNDAPQNGPYYWPANGTIDFYAYAPASVTATGTYPALSIAYTVPAAADEDFTIATPKTGLSTGTVALEFAHMLAKISVTATLHQDLIDAGYTLTTTGLTASLDVQSTGGTIDPKTTPFTWTAPNATSATYAGGTSYMIMPQSSVGCAVQVTAGIVITKGADEIYSGDLSKYTIVTGNVPGNSFEMKKHYLLNLTISDSSTGGGGEDIFNIITFTSEVAPWDTPAGEDTPLVQP